MSLPLDSPIESMDTFECLAAVWLNFPPVQQMLDHLTFSPTPSATIGTPYFLQAFLWNMRGAIRDRATSLKISAQRSSFPRTQDPAEAHDALVDSCLKSPGANSPAEILADHESIWYHIAEIFPSQRTVLPLGTSGDGDNLQQLIDRNRHMCPTGTPKLQILELGRRGFDEKKRMWYKNCRGVTIPDKVTIDSTQYVLYALMTHTGDFRSQKYYPYVRPEGIGKPWAYYRRNVSYPVDHQRATVLNQGNGRTKYQSGPVEMHTNEVAYILYYAREDVLGHNAGITDNGASKSEPKTVPDWIVRLEATPGRATAAVSSANGTAGRPRDHEEDDEDDGQGSDEGGDEDDDDGDEDGNEEMDDMADFQEATHGTVDTSQSRPPESAVSTTGLPKLEPSGCIPKPRQTTCDYIGSDFYQGTTVDGRLHGNGTLIAIATGDKYSGCFEDGVKSGYGKMIFANGDVYKGTWARGQQDGRGTFTEALTGNRYTGGWKNGRQHGKGVTMWEKAQHQESGCLICKLGDAQIVFVGCGHICACESCAAEIDRCPMCREVIRAKQRFYFCS